jgi:DNA-binding LacI/PurR family transcriptional regulator
VKRARGPTLRDVANSTGVSTATVSFVLSNTKPVAPESRARAERADGIIWIPGTDGPPTSPTVILDHPSPALAAFDSISADHRAGGVLRSLHSLGRVVPHDVAAIGLDDIPWAALQAATQYRLPVSLIERQSTP